MAAVPRGTPLVWQAERLYQHLRRLAEQPREDGADDALAADADSANVISVVATAGTTNAGIIDDLAGIAHVTRTHDLWFHVDGAYGGAGLLAPSVRHRYRGIEHADSLVVDPHKWLFAPYDCAALVYRNPALAKAAHTQHASYLDALQTDGPTEWNPADYAYHLSRRARGLPLWFSLAVHGTQAYTDAIESALTLAADTAELIRRTPHLELLCDRARAPYRFAGRPHDTSSVPLLGEEPFCFDEGGGSDASVGQEHEVLAGAASTCRNRVNDLDGTGASARPSHR